MPPVSTKHEFVSPKPASTDPTLWDSEAINADHIYDGGSDGDTLGRDSTSATGASWLSRIPSIPVTSNDQIPNGQVRVFSGGNPRVLALRYNDNGTFIDIASRTG